jgi:hypothetical protein
MPSRRTTSPDPLAASEHGAALCKEKTPSVNRRSGCGRAVWLSVEVIETERDRIEEVQEVPFFP